MIGRLFDIGKIHFTGIGGIGMSGIAEVLVNLGYRVQGSDIAENANIERLRRHGVEVFIGHDAGQINQCGVVVVSSAIGKGNPEIEEARGRNIPVVQRAEMLAELMRFQNSIAIGGTHGKTTTTSLIASVFEAGGLNPTVINGGIINTYGSNAKLGGSEWMVVEADESDGSFVRLPALMNVITNIDREHTEHYDTQEKLFDAFRLFLQNIPFYGLGIICIDHPNVQRLMSEISDRRIITYGTSPQAMVRAVNIRLEENPIQFDITLERLEGIMPGVEPQLVENVCLPMVGVHNVVNALAAFAAGLEGGVSIEVILQGLADFDGVKRRFSKTGTVNEVTVIDDYAHHPVEIDAVIKAARSRSKGKIIAVIQPHRYSRLEALYDAFCTSLYQADIVLAMPVYAAGEAPIEGMSSEHLVEELINRGHGTAKFIETPEELAPALSELMTPGDMILCMGAGSITRWANSLPEELEALKTPKAKK